MRAQRRVLTAHLHIGFCVLDVVGQLVVPDGLDDPGRHAYRHRVVGDDHPLRHQRPGPDDAVFAHDGVVEDGSMHPDEAVVPHRAAVDEGAVAYRDVFAQNDLPAGVAVEHGVVLHIAVLAQYQRALVGPQYSPVPDVHAPAQRHVAQNRRIRRHKDSTLIPGHFSTKGEHHC